MYYIGDGLVQAPILGGFWSYGQINNDMRAISTSHQIAEALLTTGITVQLLKRSFGRQAPFTATKSGGEWNAFPGFNEYNSHVPHYDAMPSGHLATVMATTTVIAGNYPEKKFIWPVGITAMSLLGFGMLANGVHWASDYPLGLAIGYTAGSIALRNQNEANGDYHSQGSSHALWLPIITSDYQGISYALQF